MKQSDGSHDWADIQDRKNDPPPGAQVLWRDLHHLHDMTETWLLAKLVGNS